MIFVYIFQQYGRFYMWHQKPHAEISSGHSTLHLHLLISMFWTKPSQKHFEKTNNILISF